MNGGCVYLIGAGPGDPGLITVRGAELLATCDVVVYDYLAAEALLAGAKADAEIIYVGKQAGQHTMPQEQINDLLVERAKGGATVARLKGGDPFVFGRGGEEALALVEAGVVFEVVPGVTAGVAAAAYAGIPVTHRQVASAVAFITGHETPDKAESDLDFSVLGRWPGTLAFYMGVKNLRRICGELIANGKEAQTPAAIVRWGTTPQQQSLVGELATLPDLVEQADIKPPALIVVGDVVGLQDRLTWYESRPLFGQGVIVTRARAQASGLAKRLASFGAEVIETPTIRIEPADDDGPLRQGVAKLSTFDWVIFTSVNAVDAVFEAMAAVELDARALAGRRICSVGPATADRLAEHGIRADVQPAKFVTAAIPDALGDLSGLAVFCPRSDAAPPELVDELAGRGAAVTEVVAYRTVADPDSADRIAAAMAEGVDWITFTSSSTVRNFFASVDPAAVTDAGVKLASIGPVTSKTLGEFELAPTVEADPHTVVALAEAIREFGG
jgi:uroporphyrinogen III methyltransferase / synthase